MTETLADALPAEMARVRDKRDRWITLAAEHPELGPGMQLTIAIMGAELDRAAQAAASGDVADMLAALQSLRDYDDE